MHRNNSKFTSATSIRHIHINIASYLIINTTPIIFNSKPTSFLMTTHRQRLNTNDTSTTSTTHPTQQLRQCNYAHACGAKIQGRALTALNNKVFQDTSPPALNDKAFQSISSHHFEWHGIPGPRSSPLLNNKVFQDMSPPALNDKAFQSISSHRFEWQCIRLQLCISTYNMTTPTTTTNHQCIHLRMTYTTTI